MPESLRALILTPDYPPLRGGIQLVMNGLASNLRIAEPEVVTLGAPGAEELDLATPFAVLRVGEKTESANKLATACLNLLGVWRGIRRRPRVVIGGHAVTAPAAVALGALPGVAVIQYAHADEFRKRPRLAGFAVRRADAVVAVSRYAGELAVRAGCRQERVHVIPPGVESVATQGGESAGRPTVLTVARMQEAYKGHDTMIRALPAIRSRVPDVHWVVIGEGRLKGRLEQMVRDAGIADAVSFLGGVSDADRENWFARAQVFAMPSRLPPGGIGGEGFGIVYLEAASHGLPVVAARVGGALDAVADGTTGILVEPDDVGALSAAIAGLLEDPKRASALGAAGRERARDFTWRSHAEGVESVIRDLVGGP